MNNNGYPPCCRISHGFDYDCCCYESRSFYFTLFSILCWSPVWTDILLHKHTKTKRIFLQCSTIWFYNLCKHWFHQGTTTIYFFYHKCCKNYCEPFFFFSFFLLFFSSLPSLSFHGFTLLFFLFFCFLFFCHYQLNDECLIFENVKKWMFK